jgi:hypothetical protein
MSPPSIDGGNAANVSGPVNFAIFCNDLELARVKRRDWYRSTITELALAKKDFRGIAWLAAVTEPERYRVSGRARAARAHSRRGGTK